MDILKDFTAQYKAASETVMSLAEYLAICKAEPLAYATAAERMHAAIGKPVLFDTSADPRLSIIHQNRTIPLYDSFQDFYGAETTIEKIAGFFKHAAQGLEERKQILYLLGPVGGGKSSLAERLKKLMQKYPIYALAFKGKKGMEISPINETPLSIFDPETYAEKFHEGYGIPSFYFTGLMSPWAVKRLASVDGDLESFCVVRRTPSVQKELAISKTEPGDENNQDISALVGKSNLRELENFSQDDTDSYSYSGGLCKSNQGLLEFVEMFKAPIKVLNPLLTATQERNYKATESLGAIPFDGVVLAHSNQTEWTAFKNNKNNEAFLDRVKVIKVPYCLQSDEEVKIYQKMIRGSTIKATIAPRTLEMLAEFAVLSRLVEHENSTLNSKRGVYNGEDMREKDPKAKSIQEYRETAGVDEGMAGISTRFCYKVLSETLNRDPHECAADPILLMDVLDTQVEAEQFPNEAKLRGLIKVDLSQRYMEFVGKEISSAYLDQAGEYGQNIFDLYVAWADCWLQRNDFKDAVTGNMLDNAELNKRLEGIEKPAGIANPKDFRNEIVHFVLRHRAENGKPPSWKSYNKIREVIEKNIFASMEDMLGIISFGTKGKKEDESKHTKFVARMVENGYTERQTRRIVEWFLRVRKSS